MTTKRTNSLRLAAALTGMLLLAACTHGASQSAPSNQPVPTAQAAESGPVPLTSYGGDGKTIGVVSLAASNGGSARMVEAMKAEAKAHDWKVQVVDTGGDASKVGGAIQSFIAAKDAGIVIDILDPSVVASDIAAAKSAGIPVISVNSNDYDANVIAQIVANPFDVGTQEATYIADRLGRKGSVALLTFSQSTNIRQREVALQAALKSYPGIKVVATHDLNVAAAVDDARNTVQQWLTRYPKGSLDAVWGAWDEPATGAANAVDAAGRKDVFVTGTDYSPATGALLKQKGALQADWFIDYQAIGKSAISAFGALSVGKTLPPHIYVSLQLVTPANVPGDGFPPASTMYQVWNGQ